MDIPKDLLQHAAEAMQHAYAPYSNLKVGACIRSKSGKLYKGCNVENISFSLTTCAEVAAICQMVSAGEQAVEEILIINPADKIITPCGACRQRLFELASEDTMVYVACKNSAEAYHLSALLPHPFNYSLSRKS